MKKGELELIDYAIYFATKAHTGQKNNRRSIRWKCYLIKNKFEIYFVKKHFYGGGNMFKLHSEYKPTGDQPQAIEYLSKGIKEGKKFQTLLGVTGSGKTFTMANIIQKVQRPTLVLAHKKL